MGTALLKIEDSVQDQVFQSINQQIEKNEPKVIVPPIGAQGQRISKFSIQFSPHSERTNATSRVEDIAQVNTSANSALLFSSRRLEEIIQKQKDIVRKSTQDSVCPQDL